MPASHKQSLLFRGIYEFDDPSGSLLAVRIPAGGTVDLYEGTAVVVRPNQCALFVYKGHIADVLLPGTHEIRSENVPIITRLANWKFGFKSPIRCELWFFSGQQFTARRWGTAQPVLAELEGRSVPIRAYGNFNVRITDPRKMLMKLLGTRATMGISEVEEFIQGHLLEQFPVALAEVKSIAELSRHHKTVSQKLEWLVAKALQPFGIVVAGIQVLSLLPPKEVLQAMDEKLAMDLIGNKRDYLLYKAASSLDALHPSKGSDPMQMMMGLMIGKGLLGYDYHEKEQQHLSIAGPNRCPHCQSESQAQFRFCPQCGKEQKK